MLHSQCKEVSSNLAGVTMPRITSKETPQVGQLWQSKITGAHARIIAVWGSGLLMRYSGSRDYATFLCEKQDLLRNGILIEENKFVLKVQD